ncbi:hypothetical protein FDECE_6183 [Fusarium decemcellulare]|nr:hypothetical protein FDECE_6183 [Fusarium decemcellulare]
MTKIIAVTGATGQQGGAVVRIMLQESGWQVRALTRNASSDKAKALAAQGCQVVEANLSDEDSLAAVFEGAHAVFSMTSIADHFFGGTKTQEEAGRGEEEDAMRAARAASRSSTLEHYIFSTLPHASRLSNGKYPVPHMDYKAIADERIRKELPDLAAKMTSLFVAFYPSNFLGGPFKPTEIPGSGVRVFMLPTPKTTGIGISGDMTVTPGIWVRQILANPTLTLGKYASVEIEYLTYAEMVKIWSKVTGKRVVYLEVTPEEYEEFWGLVGNEFSLQLKFNSFIGPNWTNLVKDKFVTKEQLRIKPSEAVGFRETLELLKSQLV